MRGFRHPGIGMLLFIVLAFGSAVSAQGWTPYQFGRDERYEFRLISFEQDGYEDEDWTIPRIVGKESGYIIDIRNSGEMSDDGEPLFDVGITTRNRVAETAIGDAVGVTFSGFAQGFNITMALNPFTFMFLGDFFADTEFEVGERTNILGFGRITITREETLAGRKGYVVQLETGSAGDRTVAGEWTIDPELAMPIAVRTYEGGILVTELILADYEQY